MKPDKLPSWLEMSPVMSVIADESLPLELLVLKSHLIIEVQLYHILSVRLQIEREHLPPLTFFPLAKLALGGAHSSVLVPILALNDLRNAFSHELDPANLEGAFAKFVNKTGYFWPAEDPYGKPTEFAAVRDAAVRAASGECVGQAFCTFVDFAIAANAIPLEEASTASAVANEIRGVLETTRNVQNAVHRTVTAASAQKT